MHHKAGVSFSNYGNRLENQYIIGKANMLLDRNVGYCNWKIIDYITEVRFLVANGDGTTSMGDWC